jgi:RimJ/RimL family protein N-acetyltransferase
MPCATPDGNIKGQRVDRAWSNRRVPGFATERLLAEPLARAHADELTALHSDERVMATMGGSTGTVEESHSWLERNLRHADEPEFGVFVFRERATGLSIRACMISRPRVDGCFLRVAARVAGSEAVDQSVEV